MQWFLQHHHHPKLSWEYHRWRHPMRFRQDWKPCALQVTTPRENITIITVCIQQPMIQPAFDGALWCIQLLVLPWNWAAQQPSLLFMPRSLWQWLLSHSNTAMMSLPNKDSLRQKSPNSTLAHSKAIMMNMQLRVSCILLKPTEFFSDQKSYSNLHLRMFHILKISTPGRELRSANSILISCHQVWPDQPYKIYAEAIPDQLLI